MDRSAIVWIGHSRGGEGVVLAYDDLVEGDAASDQYSWEDIRIVSSIAPTLLIYTLIVGLAGLIMGPKIFQGAAMHPKAGTWSYGYMTMLILLAPAVMDGPFADGASSAFYTRLFLFLFIAVYGSVAVAVPPAAAVAAARRLFIFRHLGTQPRVLVRHSKLGLRGDRAELSTQIF